MGDVFLENHPLERPLPYCERSPTVLGVYETPTTCTEAKDPTILGDMDEAVLYAEGVSKIMEVVYPEEVHDLLDVFLKFDEPLDPMPAGASIFYFIMIAWITTFYFTYLGRKMLSNVKNKLELHPDINKFPHIPLYWLQQSRREADLRREVRNTWAWLARRYILSPNDPLLANVDQVLGLVNWQDFDVTRNTWSLVKCILRVNALFVRVRKHRNEKRKSFKILRDVDLDKVPADGDQVHRVFEEWDDNERSMVAKTIKAKSRMFDAPKRSRRFQKNILTEAKSKNRLGGAASRTGFD